MSSIFGRLQYNFNDPDNAVKPYANSVMQHLQSLPPILEDWQFKDIADANTNGYYVNPVATSVSTIIEYAGKISTNANGVVSLSSIETQTLQMVSNANDFLDHTNRISGVTSFEQANGAIDLVLEDKPFLLTALGVGTTISYLTYQYDNVQNTATSLGSFTSLLVKDTLANLSIEMIEYNQQLGNSISGFPPSKITSLTAGQISTILSFVTNLNNLFVTRRTHDETFYANSLDVLGDYDKVDFFSTPGQTKDYLIENFTGSDKIKQRLGMT